MSDNDDYDDYDDISYEDSEFSDTELELLADLFAQEDLQISGADRAIVDHHKGELQDFSNLELATVFKDLSYDVHGGTSSFNNVEAKRIPKGFRKYRKLPTYDYVGQELLATCKDGVVQACGVEIGKCNFDFPDLLISGDSLFDMADAYTEEVKGKGSGYGFSSLSHLLAVVSLRKNPGFLEPYEGCDYTLESDGRELTIEVTGLSYKTRRTSANMILNKYAILGMVTQDKRVLKSIQLSNCEETNDTSFLRNGNFFDVESPYTENFDKMHDCIRHITEDQIKGIYIHVSKWLTSTNDVFTREVLKRPNFIFVGGKEGKFPSPFKVRKMKSEDRMMNYTVTSNLWKDNSGKDWYDGKHNSYRTVSEDEDYISMCCVKSRLVGRVNDYWHSVAEKAVDVLDEIQAVQTARIQKELFDKIFAVKGNYYSEKDGVGIAWSTTGKECLTYNCVFYSAYDPDEIKLFGKWTKEEQWFRSPGFKVSRQDINFVKKNYDALVAMYVSMISLHEPGDEYDDFMAMYTVLTCNSSWKTSDYADNSRFVTTGHLSGNQVSDLLVKPINAGKPIRSSEFLYMHLVNRFLESPPPRNLTPLFRLKLKFMCVEKDLGLAVNWQNRESDHESECCRKLLERTSEEMNLRPLVIPFYSRVASYFAKLLSVGVDYSDTKELLDRTPSEPVLNPVFYLAMCYSCKEEIEAASMSQVSTGFTVNDMVSDRGTIYFDQKKKCWTESKVCDELRKMVHKEKITGPYDGLLKILDERHEKVYLIKSKNGRGRREFATQHIKSRYVQMFEEKLASGVSLSAPDDQFLNPHKYNEMVSGFTRVVSSERPVVGSSEDRSFHCGHNMPEALAIACLCHAVVNSIPYFVTLAAIKRCNTVRECILPKGYKESVVPFPNNLKRKSRLVLSRGKVQNRFSLDVHKHAMQGMHAVISGVLNTTHVKGVENIMQNNVEMFEDTHVFTTQDDVGRAVSISPGVSAEWAQGNYIMKPMRTLNMTLQKNNDRKHVIIEHDKSSYGILEVNNILISGGGMVTQSHIHPHHIIQPLTSDSIVIDLMSCVNNSRQSVFWGDSPSLAWTCMEMCLYTLRMKWTLTKGHINYLKEIKMIPNNPDELVSGFFPRTEEAMKIFTNFLTDEQIDEVLEGKRSLFDRACNHFSKSWKSEQYEAKAITTTRMRTMDEKCRLVYNARTRKGKLRSSVVKPLTPKMRSTVRDRFMDYFKTKSRSKDAVDKAMLLKPPDVRGFIRPMNVDDKKPCIMGEIVPEVGFSRRNLICNKILGTNYRTGLTVDEKHELDSKEFWPNRNRDLRISKEEGFEIHSPSGLPVVRFFGNQRYTRPMVYNFSIKLHRPSPEKRPFVYRGSYVTDLTPCLYGRSTVNTNETLCFAVGIMNGIRKAFYKEGRKGRLSCVDALDEHSRVVTVPISKRKAVRYLNREDWSPLEIGYQRHIPGIEGTATASLNYAGFMRSGNDRGFQLLQEIFEERNSFMPSFMKNYMPSYPRFHKDKVVFNGGRVVLFGDTMISKIEVITDRSDVKYINITDEPVEVIANRFVD